MRKIPQSILVYFYIVISVLLDHSSLPNEGFVQILTDNGTKGVCRESLDNKHLRVICRELGYDGRGKLASKAPAPDTNDEIFSGSIDCDGGERSLSQCSFKTSTQSCLKLSYIKCKLFDKP